MNSLGDHFPDEAKRAYAVRAIKVGSVIRMPVAFRTTNKSKDKITVAVAVSDTNGKMAYVLINTDINLNCITTADLLACQLTVTTATYPFLDHESHVNCADLFEIDTTSVSKYISEHPECVLGDVSDTTMGEIITRLEGSPNTTNKQLRTYGFKTK